MKPQAYEALQKAKALFRHPAEVRHEAKDDIPESITQVPEPIRKPRVVLLPTNAPKFDKETMKQESKAQAIIRLAQESGATPPKQIDKYVEMSTRKACEACLAKGITKPSDIAKETGKNVNQIYTQLWNIKQRKAKTKREAREAKKNFNDIKPLSDDFDREPTAYEDRNYVVLRTRADYEEKIDALCMQRNKLEDEVKELKTIIKYLEGRVK
jgi:chaperonin cofactor prefoldin